MISLGIDLGTCNSSGAVAFGRDNILMIESRHGRTLFGKRFPSYVQFDHAGQVTEVGEAAKRELGNNPELVIWGAKRLVGLSYQEAEKKGELRHFHYAVQQSEDGGIQIKVGSRILRPQDILRIILERIKQDAEDARINPQTGGRPIESAVISVPAYYQAWRTNPIGDAARDAGFKDVQTIVEPTAAAIRHSLQVEREAVVMTVDLGGGTLDVTILQLIRDGQDLVPGELCVSGNEALGGIDMDGLLMSAWCDKSGIPDDLHVQSRFREDVERAKIRLSKSVRTMLDLPTGETIEITRDRLESDLKEFLDKCRGPIKKALQEADLSADCIDHVLFVGGPTHMPCVRKVVRDELAQLGARTQVISQIDCLNPQGTVDPMDCVSQGAALKAACIVKPEGSTVVAEGYGTIIGGISYGEVLPPSARCPIVSESFCIVHGNPNAKCIPVPLVVKVPSAETGAASGAYKYRHIGEFGLAINPTGELPKVAISVRIDANKDMQVTLQHVQSGQPITYRAPALLTGYEIQLTESPGPTITSDIFTEIKKHLPRDIAKWTEQDLVSLLHAGRGLLDLMTRLSLTEAREVRQLKEQLEQEMELAARTRELRRCPGILNKAHELASALMAAKLVSIDQYTSVKADLDRIC